MKVEIKPFVTETKSGNLMVTWKVSVNWSTILLSLVILIHLKLKNKVFEVFHFLMYFNDCINHCLRDVAHVKISVCKNKRRLIERSIKIATDSIEVRHQVPTGKTKNYFLAGCIKQTFSCMKLIFFCSFFFCTNYSCKVDS